LWRLLEAIFRNLEAIFGNISAPPCPLLALSCRASQQQPRQLSGVKQTPQFDHVAAANDPKRTSSGVS
jgi:hypothetical protein